MNFKVGQKVVCINAASANRLAPGETEEVLGKVEQDKDYTIFDLMYINEVLCFSFEEVGDHTYFEHFDFRPLDYDFVEETIKNLNVIEV
jgi:hypothetical protein